MSPLPPKQPAASRFGAVFDPWNSASTGHQRADGHPGTGWRESRNRKLNSQLGAGDGSGGQRLSDTYGAGSEDYDERNKVLIPKGVRSRSGRSVVDMLTKPGLMRQSMEEGSGKGHDSGLTGEEALMEKDEERGAKSAGLRGIFDGVVIYVNGSTFPLISDHRLKQVMSENGGCVSLHLGRRKVTHVILGRSLAATKIDQEIKRIGGVGVKYVGVEWVLESIKAGKRLPEARFSTVKTAPRGQDTVYGLYKQGAAR